MRFCACSGECAVVVGAAASKMWTVKITAVRLEVE